LSSSFPWIFAWFFLLQSVLLFSVQHNLWSAVTGIGLDLIVLPEALICSMLQRDPALEAVSALD
jgi:hypothetical protein